VLVCVSGYAQPWERTIAQYQHTAWGPKEGAPSVVTALAQSVDGYLWLGSSDGLYRFDGVVFERYQPQSGGPFPASYVTSLLALSNGDLWIGFYPGVITLLRNEIATKYTVLDRVPNRGISGLAEDRKGTIWAATSSGLARLEGSRWKEVGKDWNFPGKSANTVFLDGQGTLWVATEDTLVFLPPGATRFQSTGIRVGTVAQIAQAPNGKLWMAETTRSVRPIPLSDKSQPSDKTEVQVGSMRILFDNDGALWITSLGDGLRRAPAPELLRGRIKEFSNAVESFTARDGLNDDVVHAILQDREGSIWVATNSGLDRFRKTNLVPVVLPFKTMYALLAPGNAGDVWVERLASMVRVHGGRADRSQSIPHEAESAYRDPSGAIWWLCSDAIYRYKAGSYARIALPPSFPKPYLDAGIAATEDGSGTLWLSAEREGVFYRKKGVWHRLETTSEWAMLAARTAFTDCMGRAWIGYEGGTIILLKDENIQRVFSPDDSPVGSVRAIEGRGRHIWVAGQLGLAFFDGNRFRRIVPADAETFGSVLGVEETSDGSLWLAESRGVIEIAATEIQQVLGDPSYRVKYRGFDSFDGLPGTFAGLVFNSKAIQGTDGKLWFLATKGLVWVDPANISTNALPPPVLIRSVRADGRQAGSLTNLALPPRTTDLRISYTALSLAVPEKVRFRYRLEEVDKDWQDASTRHEAFYTRLGPGKYHFRVIACNNDGVWNEAGASLTFSIAPAWYQTVWFRTLCAAAFLGLLWTLHQFRIWKLQQSEKKLREVIATIPTFAWTASPDGTVDFLNRHYEDYTGFPIEKVVGSFWTTVVHPDDLERHVEKFRSAMATGDLFETESRFRRTDGQYLWFLTRAVPVRDSRGKIAKWYGTSIEIEDRKRAEQLQADLAHINRVSTMSELAASLAHEIKQPIGAAVTNAEACLRLLNRNEPDVPDACEAAFEMTKDARRAADIIDRVSLLYQKGRPQLKLVDVNEVVAEMLMLLRNQANHYSVTMRTDLAEGLPPVMADRVQLQQVFMNLMLNGIEAMKDDGGELSIRSQLSEDGQLLIAVADRGMGLPVERADEIFNAFFTTKLQGTGLGLAITRSILESHGGRVWATANAARGTTFHFTLPIRTTVSA
jgi:PAS domain S-box-containing protein